MRIAFYRENVTCLGPYQRFVIWVQGCLKNCLHCIAPNHRSFEGGYDISEEKLAELILQQENCEGITISGGEPFLQAEGLWRVISLVKEKKNDFGVIVYSGYTYEELLEAAQNDISIHLFLKCVDLLIDGEYIEEFNDDRGYVGSSNQRIIPITNRYENQIKDYYQSVGRKTEIVLHNDRLYLIGIPSRNTKMIWDKLKENNKNE